MKFIKWTILLLVILVVAIVTIGSVMSETEPPSAVGPEAEQLAEKMLDAVNHEAWENTRYVKWTFTGSHHYVWDKEEHWVQVEWGNHRVLLDTKAVDGFAWKNETELAGKDREKAIQTAWKYFCNDLYWLNAPVKVFDPGTERSVVECGDNQKCLKVKYTSGGVTPGDSYLWFLDENGLPTSFKMWVSIIPIKGIRATWEDWTELKTGAKIAQTHRIIGIPIVKISDVEGANSLNEIGISTNPFNMLELEAQSQ